MDEVTINISGLDDMLKREIPEFVEAYRVAMERTA